MEDENLFGKGSRFPPKPFRLSTLPATAPFTRNRRPDAAGTQAADK